MGNIYIYIFYNNLYNIIYNLYKSQWTWTDEVTIPQYQFTIQLCNHGCVDPSGTAPQGGGWVTVAPRDTCQQGNDSESAAVTWLRMESAGKKSAKYQPVVVCLRYFNFLNKFNNEHDTSWHLGIGMDHIATFAASEISNISRINAEVWAQKAGCATWRGDIWCPIWDWLETGFSQGIPKSTAKTHQFFLKIPWLQGTPICIILHLGPFVSMVATDFFTAHSSAGGLRDGRSPVPSRTRSSCGCDFPAVNMWNRVVDHKICGIPMKSWGKYVEFLWNPTWNLIFEVPRGTTFSHQWIWSWSGQDSSAASILPPSCAWAPA